MVSAGGTVGLVVLFAAVAVLVAFALRAPRPTGRAGVSITAAQSPSPTAPSLPASARSAAPGTLDATAPMGVSVDTSGFGLRASLGCRTPGALQATSDGGATWRVLSLPVAHLLRVSAAGAATGWVVGAADRCTPEAFSTRDRGRTWSGPGAIKGVWVAAGDTVITPTGTSASPCLPAEHLDGLAATGTSRATVVCGSRVLRTGDGGTSWGERLIPHAVPVAVAFSSAGRGLLALTGAGSCTGVAVAVSYDTGLTWGPPVCLPGAAEAPIGLAFASPASALLTSSGASYLSSDGGVSWRRA